MQIVDTTDSIDNNNDDKEEKKLYSNFIYTIKTEVSIKLFVRCLKYYMKFLGVSTLRELVSNDKPQKIIESDIKDYLIYLRNQKKISYTTASLYLSAVKKFYFANSDYNFKWNLIISYLGNDDTDEEEDDQNNNSDLTDGEQQDRPYSREEIKQMFNAAQDIRVKILISLLCSSGIRHGVLPNLKIKDLEKVNKFNLYKITAYRKSKKFKYYTFCTPECTNLIDTYLDYRRNKGEDLNDNSPLIREQFNTNDTLKIKNPKQLSSTTFRTLVNDVLIKYTNLRKKLNFDYENKRKVGRNPTKLTHGFRKFFTVECTKVGVYHEIVEKMLGHKLPGVRSNYLILEPNTLLEGTNDMKGYVSAIDALTINDENRLQKQVQELNEKKQETEYMIKGQLQEMIENNEILTSKLQEYEEANKEGRIMSKHHAKRLQDLETKFNEWVAAQDKERKIDREVELETDPEVKDTKFDIMLSATRETIRKKGTLERTFRDQQ